MIGTYNSNNVIQVLLYPEDNKVPEEGISGNIIILKEKTENSLIKKLNLKLIDGTFEGGYHCRIYDADFWKNIYLSRTKFDEVLRTGELSLQYIDENFRNGHTAEFLYAPMNEVVKTVIEKVYSKLF